MKMADQSENEIKNSGKLAPEKPRPHSYQTDTK
jgi:hypothetical protein